MPASVDIPPQRIAVIYDATCRFCIVGSARLAALALPGTIELVGSTSPSLAARFPQVTPEMIHAALQLVRPDGGVCSGAEAIAEALATRPLWRLVTWIYFVPGIRWLVDRLYEFVARNRYRIMGRAGTCEGGACGLPADGPAQGR